jgi:hypothetical protein
VSKPLSSWQLIKRSLRHYRRHWFGYAKIVAVTALPVGFFNLYMNANQDTTLAAYLSLASLVMTTALVWAMAQQYEGRTPQTEPQTRLPRPPGTAEAYYTGSELFVRFMLVGLSLAAIVIPLALGLALFNISLNATGWTSLVSPEQLIITAVCTLIALPTFYLLGGYSLALIAIARDGGRPLQALKTARVLVRGRYWRVVARLIILLVWLLLVCMPLALISGLLVTFGYVVWAKLTFQFYSWFIILPLMYLYLFELYISLEDPS